MANFLISTAISVGLGMLQRALTPDTRVEVEGTRVASSQITTAAEGSVIPRVYRRFRVGGQLIWATSFREEISVETTSQGGGKGSGPKQVTETTTYTYFCSFAIGICEGEEGVLLRSIFLDGNETDLSKLTYRFYSGIDTQNPDPKMVAVEGAGNVPAYRGLSYIVFDELDLTNYGNRIPQVAIEVTRLVPQNDPTNLRNTLRAVSIIPSAGEFVYATTPITRENGDDSTTVLNIHTGSVDKSDFVVSLDQLKADLPSVDSASLVVAWFGSSIDATTCTVRPKVENNTTVTVPSEWRVADLTRATAQTVTQIGIPASPAFGGTPTDLSVRQACIEMKARGIRVMFYPFILMDMAGFPWRGRLTGTVANYWGTATPAHFGAWNGTVVPYSGPNEWTHRRMILHYTRLLADVLVSGDAFLVGSEMVGLSTSNANFGTLLAALMTDVRSILPAGVLVSYAGDWSEYKVASLAPAWSSASFIGIDNYLPLTDWFDGDEVYTLDAFKAGINSGEYWDYFYANDAARISNTRGTITDPQFRQKDIRYWRDNNHAGKPVWFTEFGCPAIDKGGNQPNVFYDPKSTESFYPYRSNGRRNDTVQRLYLEAMLDFWATEGLVSPANMFAWTWDARPYPAFPARTDVWSDGPNYQLGHWLTGRISAMSLARLVTILMSEAGIPSNKIDVTELEESGIEVPGLGVFTITTVRQILENLMKTFNFDVLETTGFFKFVMRIAAPSISIVLDDIVTEDDESGYVKTRTQDTDLPDRTNVSYTDELRSFETAAVDGHTVTGYSKRVNTFESMCVLATDYALELADTLTQEAWTQKNGITLSLPLNYLRIECGDVFDLTVDGVTRRYRTDEVVIGDQIDISASGYSSVVYEINNFAVNDTKAAPVVVYGKPQVIFAELPVPNADAPNLWSPRILASQQPWPGSVLVYEDDNAGGFALNSVQSIPAIIGQTTTPLAFGVDSVWDTGSTVGVKMNDPAYNFTSTTDLAVLNGANTVAVLTPLGEWEVFQFVNANLELDGSYTLSRLIRGVLGTEPYRGNPTPAGSRFIVYDQARFGVISGGTSRFRLDVLLRYGSAGIDVSDPRYTSQTVNPKGIPYRPYSPVHLKQVNVANDITLSWIRRTRFDGDAWADGEVPLNEETETYEIVIAGGRTITVVGATSVVYTQAQQIVDFGVVQPTVAWTVYQISNRFGRGAPANG